jgi:hypothetical protein
MDGNKNRMTSGLFDTKSSRCLIAAVLFVATQNARPDTLINGSFETGDFSGWTVAIPNGIVQYGYPGTPPGSLTPAGTADVVSSWGPATGMSSAISPAGGNDFAVIGSDANAYFAGNLSYDITASQTVTLSAGSTLSGSALFYNGDYEPQDMAFVSILGDGGNCLLATPWSATSGMSTYHTATPWTAWEWQAPRSGTYTLELGVATGGDDAFASYGMFDNISVTPAGFNTTEVPEPSCLGLFGLGAAGFVGVRRWMKK